MVQVYVPRDARGQRALPFIVSGDGIPASAGVVPLFRIEPLLFPALDNLIRERRVPPMVAITVENGGQDAQGSQRGFEYDSINGQYAEFIETEVLPQVEKIAGIRLTHDPAGRIAMGFSASAEAAFTMAWFHPELFGKVLSYSPTFTNQQWPHNPNLPGGAWQYHSQYAGPPPTQLLQTESFNVPTPVAANQSPACPSFPTVPGSLSGCGTRWVITTAGIPTRWRTGCTIMCSLARTWPRRSLRKGTSTSSSSPTMPGM
ncbi:alpha/beta hydrolase-fold protein [Paraburkholderia sp. FT54]|uniref:alpha/beta hydrolase n=1 Tax=Paraburkholderia sp. FT54 TaxID=3074437 RepID=UPI002877E4C6|nr:alpha/beta hydrolase-fold protein [Paraburkholderia sp. FT54]WNC93193.1 alpha/beta hydrolase-fold protein [Paraburkholderia sp. FT54]